ncbi:hypothetical protein ACQY0O_004536 [Thecaphora frezii]
MPSFVGADPQCYRAPPSSADQGTDLGDTDLDRDLQPCASGAPAPAKRHFGSSGGDARPSLSDVEEEDISTLRPMLLSRQAPPRFGECWVRCEAMAALGI